MEPLTPRPIQARDLQSWLQDDRPDPLLVDVREDAELDLTPSLRTCCIGL
jgi:rhodanese-related sulfurtransferase